jgi:hypothetical protein
MTAKHLSRQSGVAASPSPPFEQHSDERVQRDVRLNDTVLGERGGEGAVTVAEDRNSRMTSDWPTFPDDSNRLAPTKSSGATL